jgi:hypothetical protein
MENKENKKEKVSIQFTANRNPYVNIKNIEKVGTRQYIEFGPNNILPNDIITTLENSPKTASILKSLAKYIEGDGFDIENMDDKTLRFLENQYGDDDMEEIVEKMALDLMYFGGTSLNTVWSNDGSRISLVKHVPFQKVRIYNPDLNTENRKFLLSKDWADSKEKTRTIEVAEFDAQNKEEKSQLLYIKRYTVGLDYYCLPHWYSAYNYARLDSEIMRYQLACAIDGYTPSLLFNLATGIPAPEQQEDIAKKMDEKFKGSTGAKTILTFSDGKESAPEITVIDQTAADSKYLNVEEMVLNNVLIANNITNPNMVGVRVPGELGGSEQIIESFLLLQETFITTFQKIIEKKLNLLNYYANGMDENLTPIKIKQFNITKLLWNKE